MAFLVALAFAVAASANVPVILLTIFWKRFNTTGAVTGILVGLISVRGPDHTQPERDDRPEPGASVDPDHPHRPHLPA